MKTRHACLIRTLLTLLYPNFLGNVQEASRLLGCKDVRVNCLDEVHVHNVDVSVSDLNINNVTDCMPSLVSHSGLDENHFVAGTVDFLSSQFALELDSRAYVG